MINSITKCTLKFLGSIISVDLSAIKEMTKCLNIKLRHSPGYAQSPEQRQQLDSEVQHKPAVIPFSHTVLDPGAVMIVATDAVLTGLTVLGSHWLL